MFVILRVRLHDTWSGLVFEYARDHCRSTGDSVILFI